MSLEIIAMLVMGATLAALMFAQMIHSEQDRINKRIDRLEEMNRAGASFERPTESLEQRAAYLEGWMKGRTGKNPL